MKHNCGILDPEKINQDDVLEIIIMMYTAGAAQMQKCGWVIYHLEGECHCTHCILHCCLTCALPQYTVLLHWHWHSALALLLCTGTASMHWHCITLLSTALNAHFPQ